MNEKKTSEVLINNLNTFMREMGTNKNQLAKRMNKHAVTITRWLNGTRGISLENLDELSVVLNVRAIDLINPKLKIRVEKKIIIS